MNKSGLLFVIAKEENNLNIHQVEKNRLNYGAVCYAMLFSFLKLISQTGLGGTEFVLLAQDSHHGPCIQVLFPSALG